MVIWPWWLSFLVGSGGFHYDKNEKVECKIPFHIICAYNYCSLPKVLILIICLPLPICNIHRHGMHRQIYNKHGTYSMSNYD